MLRPEGVARVGIDLLHLAHPLRDRTAGAKSAGELLARPRGIRTPDELRNDDAGVHRPETQSADRPAVWCRNPPACAPNPVPVDMNK